MSLDKQPNLNWQTSHSSIMAGKAWLTKWFSHSELFSEDPYSALFSSIPLLKIVLCEHISNWKIALYLFLYRVSSYQDIKEYVSFSFVQHVAEKQVINKFFLKSNFVYCPSPSCLEENKKKVFQLFFSLENVVKDQCRQMFMDIKGHLQKLFQSAHNAVLIA